MLATRTTRSRRPADPGAGRPLTRLVLVIALLIGTVFAHGGACAAVELAESTGHGVRAAEPAAPVCLHRNLPPRHQHGTEQDCSATGPAAAPAPSAVQAVAVVPAAGPCAGKPPVAAGDRPPPGSHQESLCVMRV